MAQTDSVTWAPPLMLALLDELYVSDEISHFLGDPRSLPRRRYPQAVVLALVLRHSWRADDLRRLLRRLKLPSDPETTPSRASAKLMR